MASHHSLAHLPEQPRPRPRRHAGRLCRRCRRHAAPIRRRLRAGLGWQSDTTGSGAPLIEHDGDMMTFTAYQAILPGSGYGIAVMANTGTLHRDAQAIGARPVAPQHVPGLD
ncbi:serine hydrolase [Micromonospora sp. CA-111912]|uniref:serine hydrolase n=1 Tax=Micromonospora sp. CA-111912 TaxID=3239955 RepID=UPI003D92E152